LIPGLLSAAGAATWIVWINRSLVASAFHQIQHHTMTIAVIAGIVSAIVVSRRRSIHAARAVRSWVTALPVSPRARRVEALAMDPASAQVLKRHLHTRLTGRGATLLLATHSLDIVEHHADRAGLLVDGRLRRIWQREDLLQMRSTGQRFEDALAASMSLEGNELS
jgi:hypothetical protein